MSASIIVPVYNALEYARACIESVYRARVAMSFEVIVVDNGSGPETREWLAFESARRVNFRVLQFHEPIGFPRAANEGARAARHELLVLLNSDTLVYDGWLDGLEDALARNCAAVAGPVTNHCGHQAQKDPDATQGPRYASAIRHRAAIDEPQKLVFFCAMIRRSLWRDLNGLDEIYSPGNFEDDDFCLRARLAGHRLAIARGVFVFHHERKTFDENRMEHGEALARGERFFVARAAAWSKSAARRVARSKIENIAVIVPVPADRTAEAGDTLASLANQTVTGFEIIVVSPADIPGPHTMLRREGNLGSLLNAGIAAARGQRIAFLPAGDLFYPFHLEVLAGAGAGEAAYSAWSVDDGAVIAPVRLDQAAPDRLHTGDWAPLASWMHSSPPLFDESLDSLCGWDWVMRLPKRPRYVPRVTCHKKSRPSSAGEARRVMELHPVADPWRRYERRRFLAAVEAGPWERTLILEQNPVERRARRMLASANLRLDRTALDSARLRFSGASARRLNRAIFLFSIIRWTDLVQRPHHFARGLARRGFRVFWIDVRLKAPEFARPENLATEIEPNLEYVELPCAAAELYRLEWTDSALDAMEAALASLGVESAIQLVQFPKWTPLVQRLRRNFGWPIVYDCLDDQRAFGDLYAGNESRLEDVLIGESAAVITSGRTLQDRLPSSALISNAADYELFRNAESRGLLKDAARPVIGFFGAFSGWLDFEWVGESARRFPGWLFVYIGRDAFSSREAQNGWKQATSIPNIRVIGQQAPEALAAYLADFDICTMPFRDVPVTRSMNAVKIFEYLAAGKAVVARDLPETRPLAERGLIQVYRSLEESFGLLEQAVATGSLEDSVRARRSFAAENTWAQRIDQLTGVLDCLWPGTPRP